MGLEIREKVENNGGIIIYVEKVNKALYHIFCVSK